MSSPSHPTGPRGGTTTTRKGQTKKVYWLEDDICEALRLRAFEERRPEVVLVREALRQYLGLED